MRELVGFRDALDALALLRDPEAEQKGSRMEGLRDLVFNHLLVRPELEGVREMAWLQAKVIGYKKGGLRVRKHECRTGDVPEYKWLR